MHMHMTNVNPKTHTLVCAHILTHHSIRSIPLQDKYAYTICKIEIFAQVDEQIGPNTYINMKQSNANPPPPHTHTLGDALSERHPEPANVMQSNKGRIAYGVET
jgi:hypothetical protein